MHCTNDLTIFFFMFTYPDLSGDVFGILISTISISASSLPPNELDWLGQLSKRLLLLNDSAKSWVSVSSARRLGNWLKRVVSSRPCSNVHCVADNWSNDRWSSTQTTSLVNWPARAPLTALIQLLLLVARARARAASWPADAGIAADDPGLYPA